MPLQRPARAAWLTLSPELALALFSLYWALWANRPVLAALRQQMPGQTLPLLASVLLLALLHYLLVAPFLFERATRLLLLALTAVAVFGSHFTQSLGTVLDPAMLRNLLRTNVGEARELANASLAWHVAVGLLPAVLLLAVLRVRRRHSGLRALGLRGLAWGGALLSTLGLLMLLYQPLSSLMRNHRALRYQVLPAAPLWSLPRSAWQDLREAQQPRAPIGLDATPGPSWSQAARPRLLVWVVGETVRAANWGHQTLPDGSERVTTPQLLAEPGALQFPLMQTCGTDTESSLPCMFAPVGRRDYDEGRIRREQSLLHVLARAGVKVDWRDAQSGCKGVCTDLPTTKLDCGERCDEQLFALLPERLKAVRAAGGTHVLVLHMLGNHGPAYFRRYGPAHARFKPACEQDDFGPCSREQIRNAYDNALLATDALLAGALRDLRAAQSELDVALLFTPDHGESLGERGLYLHGMPYAFAPREQTEVPMLFWLSEGWRAQRGWRADCLRALPQQAAPRHDHLFHTVLDLLDVRTALRDPQWNLLQPCAA